VGTSGDSPSYTGETMNTNADLLAQGARLVSEVRAQPAWALLTEAGVILSTVFKWLKPVARLVEWFRARRAAAVADTLKRMTQVASFSNTEIREAVQQYIVPDTSNVDPTNDDDLRHFAFVREGVFAVIERALTAKTDARLLVLADSGMGKTTLLLNIFARELKKRDSHRRNMALVPLGRPDADEQIKAVIDKSNTILLLDAFDEDTQAIDDYQVRLQQVMELAANFKAVILTCRTQFFANDQAIPTSARVPRVGPKKAGTEGSQHFQRIYLLPFISKQIDAYLRTITPWYGIRQRRQAHALVKRIPELTVRPMLLGLLPDLLKRPSEFTELWDLYEFMVESWLTRESHWIDPKELLAVSKKIAVDIYLNRSLRRSERLSLDELALLLERTSSSIVTWKLTGRSLLNRDSAGNYKFAHRSIMEFLFIAALVDGNDDCAAVAWTDMMRDLFFSWGRSATDNASLARAQYLLEDVGLSETRIFPFVEAYEPVARIEALGVRRALGQSADIRKKAGIPAAWRKWTSRVIERQDVMRAYEFSEGLVWQCIDMRLPMDLEVFRVHRKENRYIDHAGGEWVRPTLAEFHSLVQVLHAHDVYPLHEGDLYWLRDEDAQFLAMARVRRLSEQPAATSELRDGARLIIASVANISSDWTLDVYAVPKLQRRHQGQLHYPATTAAFQVVVWHGNALDRWVAETRDTARWGMTSEALVRLT
jgi:hypothetical protein